MLPATGTTLIHPVHGLTVVHSTQDREVGGEAVTYVRLDAPQHGMEIFLPVDALDESGVREAADAAAVGEVLELLAGDADRPKGVWSAALRRNTKRLTSGRLRQVAIALRELAAKHQERGTLSPSERRLEQQAHEMIVGEVAAGLDCDLPAAEARVAEALGEVSFAEAA